MKNPAMRGVSAIIPAYNYGGFVERAIRSAAGQGYEPMEVIVVDDGSTDDTAEVCERLKAELPMLVYVWQKNAGLSAARNTGVRTARYPFVAFLDADDEWAPGMIPTLMDELMRLPESVPLAACGSYRVDPSGTPIGEKKIASWGDRFFSAGEILVKNRFMPSTVVARREAVIAGGLFDTTLRSSEDRDMWIRMAAKHPVRYLDRPLVRICRHSGNMSRHADRMRLNMRRVREKVFSTGVIPRWDLGFRMWALALDHFQCAWMYWDEKRRARAVWHGLLSILICPVPLNHRAAGEPLFFRVRALVRFILNIPFKQSDG